MSDEDQYFPTFSEQDGQYYVQWKGREWGLLTPIKDDWQYPSYHGSFDPSRRGFKVHLSFTMCELRGENK